MKRLAMLLAFSFVFCLAGFGAYAADNFDLTIPLPLTGKQAKFGEIMKRSFEMGVEEMKKMKIPHPLQRRNGILFLKDQDELREDPTS